MRIVLITMLLFSLVEAQAVQSFDIGKTWKEAHTLCKMVTPDLKYSAHGISVDLDTSDLHDGDQVWLGYVQAFQIFQYTGCAKIESIRPQPAVANFTVYPDLGQCFSACRSQYFGIRKNGKGAECYCFCDKVQTDNPEDLRSDHCTLRCDNPYTTACGGSRGHISLYQHVTNTTLEKQTSHPERLCCTYKVAALESRLAWRSCTLPLRIMCETETPSTVKVQDKFGNWLQASNVCFSNKELPVTYIGQLTLNTPPAGRDLWTGMLRSGVSFKHNESPYPPFKYGYMELENGVLDIRFSNESALLQKALCYKDNEDTSPTVPPISAGPDPLYPGCTYKHSGTPKDDNQSTDESESIGVYVGVAVGILLLLACAAAVFVICRKRQKPPSQTGETMNMIDRSKVADDVYSDPDENQSHDKDRAQNTRINTEIAEVYDTTNAASKGDIINNSENVYNRLNTEADDTYSHATSNPNLKSFKSGNNTYNTSSQFQNNKTGNGKTNTATDNEYSHIAVPSGSMKHTDNVYAKANLSDRNADKAGEVETGSTYHMVDDTAIDGVQSGSDYTYSQVNKNW